MAWPNVYGLDVAMFDKDAPTHPPKPTILLVHDAFHTSTHFESLANELRQANCEVAIAQLPSSSSSYQPSVFEADVHAVFEAGRTDIEASRNVILVMHGYGSLPGSVAADRLNQHSLNRPRAGEVTQLIFIAGVIAEEGKCFDDVLKPDWMAAEVNIGTHSLTANVAQQLTCAIAPGRWSESCRETWTGLLPGLWSRDIPQRYR